MALAILGDPQPQPPAPLIRLHPQQPDIELGRLGILSQLLAQAGPGRVIVEVAGQGGPSATEPGESPSLVLFSQGQTGPQQAKIGLIRLATNALLQQGARLGEAALAIEQARQLLPGLFVVRSLAEQCAELGLGFAQLPLDQGRVGLAFAQYRELGRAQLHRLYLEGRGAAWRRFGRCLGGELGMEIRLQLGIARFSLLPLGLIHLVEIRPLVCLCLRQRIGTGLTRPGRRRRLCHCLGRGVSRRARRWLRLCRWQWGLRRQLGYGRTRQGGLFTGQ